jgi:hypothetical protein
MVAEYQIDIRTGGWGARLLVCLPNVCAGGVPVVAMCC